MPELSSVPEVVFSPDKKSSSSENIAAYYATISRAKSRAFSEEQKPKEWQGVGDKLETLGHSVAQMVLSIKNRVAQISADNEVAVSSEALDSAQGFARSVSAGDTAELASALKGTNAHLSPLSSGLSAIENETYSAQVFASLKKVVVTGYFTAQDGKKRYGYTEFSLR